MWTAGSRRGDLAPSDWEGEDGGDIGECFHSPRAKVKPPGPLVALALRQVEGYCEALHRKGLRPAIVGQVTARRRTSPVVVAIVCMELRFCAPSRRPESSELRLSDAGPEAGMDMAPTLREIRNGNRARTAA